MRLSRGKMLILFILAGIGLSSGATSAVEVNTRAGTSGFSFLKLGIGARAVGMGGAFTGLADDPSTLYYNPAGIAGMPKGRYILEYLNYFDDMQSGFAGITRHVGEKHVLGFYADYLNYGEFLQTDTSGRILNNFSGGNLVMGLTLASRVSYGVMIGVTGKFIYEGIQNYSATGLAADLGLKYATNRDQYSFGVAIQNLGTQLSGLGSDKDRLPLTFRTGGAVRPKGLPLIVSTDLVFPIDNDPHVAIGGEYRRFEPILLRLGWNSFGKNFRAAYSDDKWAGLGLGVGFLVKTMEISYAFAPGADLGDSHRITLTGNL
jgi:hypothetical protein